MANIYHKNFTITDGIHHPISYEYADATARLAATGFISTDVRKFARQLDNDYIYMLTGFSPITWALITSLGTDADAIHDNVASEISAITEKATPIGADLIVIEDSADSNNKKKVKLNNLPASSSYPEYLFNAVLLENPNNSDWAVNALANAAVDSNNNGLRIRAFDDTTEEGVGFTVQTPSGATNIIFDIKSRAETAPGSGETVAINLYNREIPDNSSVEAWSTATQLTDINIPTNEYFQYDSETIALSTLGINAGNQVQFELTRDTADAGDTLTGDWDILTITVRFS